MREAIERAGGKAQRLPNFTRSASPAISNDIRGHGGPILSVAPINFLDHFFPPIATREIKIDIRPAFASFAQEPLENEMITHGINRRDPEAVTNRAVGGAAATLHHDVVLAAKIHDVPDNQEVAGKF